jgi:hypothetical protein
MRTNAKGYVGGAIRLASYACLWGALAFGLRGDFGLEFWALLLAVPVTGHLSECFGYPEWM